MAPQAEDELTPGEIRRWLERVETEVGRSLTRIEREQSDFRTQVDHRFDRLQSDVTGSIASLGAVRRDVYESDQRTMNNRIDAVEALAKASHTLTMWNIGLIVSLAIGALFALIKLAG